MNRYRFAAVFSIGCLIAFTGCTARNVDFSKIQRPQRSAELDAYDVFVGDWNWTAKVLNAKEGDSNWTGAAHWDWTLDKRALEGTLSAKSASAQFEARGLWSWHPKRHRYIWTMFNDWGYPQHGYARYEEAKRRWVMNYKSVGLDGTRSTGRYIMTAVDNNTLEWSLDEWAGPLHLIKKLRMEGTYTRR